MRLHKLRIGFATNSSSTHSIVFLGKPVGDTGPDHGPQCFGWDYFTCGSAEAKRDYLAQTIFGELRGLPDWLAREVGRLVAGANPDPEGYVDHQSHLNLPRDWESETAIDREFADALAEYLMQPGVAILGGNDNDCEDHPLLGGNEPLLREITDIGGSWVCRHEGDSQWTMFSRRSGNKISVSLSLEESGWNRPLLPELVDIKLTDYCPFDCAYCYQASTESGQHADINWVGSLLNGLDGGRVFEIAFGGGEPTLHPEFVEVMRRCRSAGVVPNFTTRNLAWLRDEELRPAIIEHCGAFAVSVEKGSQVRKLAALRDRHGIDKRINLHVVMGVVDKWDFNHLLREAHSAGFTAVLLGYKTTGRGSSQKPKDYSWWLDQIKGIQDQKNCPRLGIDTVLAAQFTEQLEAAGIPNYLYYTTEGSHSMYVDAVAKTYGRSSFAEDLQPMPTKKNQWRVARPDLRTAWDALA